MSDVLAIGESDLATVAASAACALLSGIEIDGIAFPPILSQVYPTSKDDLPCICVVAPQQTFTITNGRRGQRLQRTDLTIRISVVMSAPLQAKHTMEILMGKVTAEIKRRLSANRSLTVDGEILAHDLTLQSIAKGLSDRGPTLTVMVSVMNFAAVILSVEGDDTRVLQSFQGA